MGVEAVGDTFRIWDGIAHSAEPILITPAEEIVVTFTDWVRDGNGSLPQDPATTGNGFPISVAPGNQRAAATGFDGTNYLAVWIHRDPLTYRFIRGARIAQDGHVLDSANGFEICGWPDGIRDYPQVAFDGQNYLVVWEDFRRGERICDVYGARVSQAGQVLDPDGFPICTTTYLDLTPNLCIRPAVAFMGDKWFVTWVNMYLERRAIFGSGVSRDGQVLNPGGVKISTTSYNEQSPAITAGPGSYLVAWDRVITLYPFVSELHGALITPEGTVVQRIPIAPPPGLQLNRFPRVSFSGTGYEVVWQGAQFNTVGWDIWGWAISLTGSLTGDPAWIRWAPAMRRGGEMPDIGFDGFAYLVVWQDGRDEGVDHRYDIYGKRLTREGGIIEPEIPICVIHGSDQHEVVSIAFGQQDLLAVWSDDRNHPSYDYDIFGELVDATLISQNATYANNGRHLTRAPNQSAVDWVFSTNIGFFAQNRGEVVLPPYYVGRGGAPTIAENEPLTSWTCETTGDSLNCFIRRPDGTWRKVWLCSPDAVNAPSLCLSQIRSVIDPSDMGYVVFVTTSFIQNTSYIRFAAFDSLGTYCMKVLDEADLSVGAAVSSPSIAVTPGDFLHIVWCKRNSGGEPRVYYQGSRDPVLPYQVRNGQPLTWWNKTLISAPSVEPASHCFVEAQGQWIIANWRGPNGVGADIGEIWQRTGTMQPNQPPFWPPAFPNKSQTPGQESDYPSRSTPRAVVWQEQLPAGPGQQFDVLARVDNDLVNLSNTTSNSRHPHANVFLDIPYPPGLSRLTAVWTEESPPVPPITEPLYSIHATDYYFLSSLSGRSMVEPDLAVVCGDSVASPYCLEREGYDRSGSLPIDYSHSGLAYRLPYLNPRKYYLMEAVGYQAESDTVREMFGLPGGRKWELRLRRGVPETLKLIIPPGTYDSCAITLWIARLRGSVAALAGLNLYEFESARKQTGGSQGEDVGIHVTGPTLLASTPNPFSGRLNIVYQLPKPGSVDLEVCDASGRVIRILEHGNREAGANAVVFDGRDCLGERLTAGVYFIRLKAVGVVDTRKVILSR